MWRHLQLTRGRTASLALTEQTSLNVSADEELKSKATHTISAFSTISRANSRRSRRIKCPVQLLPHCEQGEGERALPRQSKLAATEQALREFRAWQDIENAASIAPPPSRVEQKWQFLLGTNSGRWMQVIPRFALKHASSPRGNIDWMIQATSVHMIPKLVSGEKHQRSFTNTSVALKRA
ncbi:hypothetical protein N9L68_00515 [bacterium]|nr:hypothetical protein [bacterium]